MQTLGSDLLSSPICAHNLQQEHHPSRFGDSQGAMVAQLAYCPCELGHTTWSTWRDRIERSAVEHTRCSRALWAFTHGLGVLVHMHGRSRADMVAQAERTQSVAGRVRLKCDAALKLTP
jgi:hypothetical protein